MSYLQVNTNNNSSNWSYRRYLQQNANEIMKHNTMAYISESGNNPYILSNNSVVNDNKSDLKNKYLQEQQIKAKMYVKHLR
jgi:hypothetical protein